MASDLHRRGLATRREVLGSEHVDRSLARATDFSGVIQEFVTEYCWGAVWSRPGLERRERSLVNLAMLTALNRSHELRVHVRGAIRNGCTPGDIQEVLLQAAVYCGVPAAMEAFRIADEVISQMQAEETAARDGGGSAAEADEAGNAQEPSTEA